MLRGQVTDVPMHDEELGPISRAEANEALANGTAEDVAKVILFLASDAAEFITGEYIAVNGGLYMRV